MRLAGEEALARSARRRLRTDVRKQAERPRECYALYVLALRVVAFAQRTDSPFIQTSARSSRISQRGIHQNRASSIHFSRLLWYVYFLLSVSSPPCPRPHSCGILSFLVRICSHGCAFGGNSVYLPGPSHRLNAALVLFWPANAAVEREAHTDHVFPFYRTRRRPASPLLQVCPFWQLRASAANVRRYPAVREGIQRSNLQSAVFL